MYWFARGERRRGKEGEREREGETEREEKGWSKEGHNNNMKSDRRKKPFAQICSTTAPKTKKSVT